MLPGLVEHRVTEDSQRPKIGHQRLLIRTPPYHPSGQHPCAPFRVAVGQVDVFAHLTGHPIRDGPAPPGRRRQGDHRQAGEGQSALVVPAGLFRVRIWSSRVAQIPIPLAAGQFCQLAQLTQDGQPSGYGSTSSCRDPVSASAIARAAARALSVSTGLLGQRRRLTQMVESAPAPSTSRPAGKAPGQHPCWRYRRAGSRRAWCAALPSSPFISAQWPAPSPRARPGLLPGRPHPPGLIITGSRALTR
jgi:hypothetical protein